MTKANMEKKEFISDYTSQSIMKKSQDRHLQTGTGAEATEAAAYWPIPCGWLSLLSYAFQDHLPRGGTAHNGLGPPTSITNQENPLQTCLTGQSEAFSQLRFFLPR